MLSRKTNDVAGTRKMNAVHLSKTTKDCPDKCKQVLSDNGFTSGEIDMIVRLPLSDSDLLILVDDLVKAKQIESKEEEH